MFTSRLSHCSSLLLALALVSLLHSTNASFSAILNTTGYSNSSTTAVTVVSVTRTSTISTNFTFTSPTITSPTTSTTTAPSSIFAATTPSLLLTTEIATGANGVQTTITSLVIAGGSATGMLGTVTEAGTTPTPSPGLQSSAVTRKMNGVERALLGVVVVATWMVVWC